MTGRTAESFQIARFQAMSCPCEVLLDSQDPSLLAEQMDVARQEARRIEQKYSRYLSNNIVHEINHSGGKPVKVDDETAALFDYASECYVVSQGLFDITRIGWDQVSWKRPFIELPLGFEIDFGGICKEYAADRILALLTKRAPMAMLVNLGGDIAASGDRLWSVGIEDISRPGQMARTIHIRQGGVATSGTTQRPGHIVTPKTGRPVTQAPRSVTVAAKTCTEAGFWSTLAILQGVQAETFLEKQGLEFWCYR